MFLDIRVILDLVGNDAILCDRVSKELLYAKYVPISAISKTHFQDLKLK